MISFTNVVTVLKSFADNHLQVHKFGFEFKDQMPNLATVDEKYPLLFVVPVGATPTMNTNELEVDIYCLDRLQKDRSNASYVISDTQLILTDLTVWLEDSIYLDVIRSYPMTPINSDLLDYCDGWVMRLRLEVDRIALCEIPILEIDPLPIDLCGDVTIQNSDLSFSVTSECDTIYTLPDTVTNVYIDTVFYNTYTRPTLG